MSSSHTPPNLKPADDFMPISNPIQLVQLFKQKAAARQEDVVTVQARCIEAPELELLDSYCC